MTREIVIDFDVEREDFFRVWQFGEDLYRLCVEEPWATISLEEVDRATNKLRVTVFSKRHVRRIEALIRRLLEQHFLDRCARLSERAILP